jgi:hypothetical protein
MLEKTQPLDRTLSSNRSDRDFHLISDITHRIEALKPSKKGKSKETKKGKK